MKKKISEILLSEIKPLNIDCPECGSKMTLRQSRFGIFYGCDDYFLNQCKGRVSAKPDGTIKIPFISYAEKQARFYAKEAFDKLWQSGSFTKQEAFNWLCEEMQCDRSEALISKFTIQQCRELIEKVGSIKL
jgi:ssDNA-binding Zn-finger/Zn-ribbon topoisomerase 1